MRLRPVLLVSDSARKMIAKLRPGGARTARGAKASRELVITYLQDRLDQLSALHPWWDDEPLRDDEIGDARAAVEYLRRAGKSDADIRAWLLCQRARYDLGNING